MISSIFDQCKYIHDLEKCSYFKKYVDMSLSCTIINIDQISLTKF